MRIVVVSDTHRDFDRLYRLALMQQGRADLFIHLGDGEQEVDDLRAAFPSLPLLSVRGNCDLFSTAPDHQVFEEGGVRLFACHGHNFSVRRGLDGIRSFARANGVRVALFGHTHCRCCVNEGTLTIMNPGSLSQPRDGIPNSYGVIEIINGQAFCHLEQLDGEENAQIEPF